MRLHLRVAFALERLANFVESSKLRGKLKCSFYDVDPLHAPSLACRIKTATAQVSGGGGCRLPLDQLARPLDYSVELLAR
jgi:hypothetical protein